MNITQCSANRVQEHEKGSSLLQFRTAVWINNRECYEKWKYEVALSSLVWISATRIAHFISDRLARYLRFHYTSSFAAVCYRVV